MTLIILKEYTILGYRLDEVGSQVSLSISFFSKCFYQDVIAAGWKGSEYMETCGSVVLANELPYGRRRT